LKERYQTSPANLPVAEPVQNSVFEGEISESNYKKLKMELSKIIKTEEDSVIFYTFRTTKYSKRESIGIKKGGDDNII